MNKLIVCNLKTNKSYQDMQKYVYELEKIKSVDNNVVFCPSSLFLHLFSKFTTGSQQITAYENYNVTGEITGEQLKSLNCQYVIIAHQEQRIFLQEDNEMFIKKIKNTVKNGLIPIVCIGERKKSNSLRIIKNQILQLTKNLTATEIDKLIFAYEPFYMINSHYNIDILKISTTIDFIKKFFRDKYQKDIIVLYGGSIDENNIDRLKKIKDLDGYLLGRSCLDITILNKILEKINS